MFNFVAVAIYALACSGIGAVVNHSLFGNAASAASDRRTTLRRLGLNFAVGSSLLAAVLILVALGGHLTLPVVWSGIIAFAITYILTEIRLFSATVGGGSNEAHQGTSTLAWALAAAAVLLYIWYGMLAYTRPPFGDADAFYMTYPKVIAATGTLRPMVFTYRDFSTIGLLGELHFAALMVIADPAAAKLFAWLAGGSCVLVLCDITRKLGGGGIAQALLAGTLLTSTTFTDYLSDGKTELFPALTALAVIRILLEISPKSAKFKTALAIGVLSAIAGYSKFSYIVCLFPTIVIFTLTRLGPWQNFYGRNGARVWAFIGLCVAGAVLGLIPHLLKNALLFGNPFAPFFGSTQNWADQSGWFSSADTAWIMLTYPIALVFGQYPLMGGNVSFIWLLTLPLIFFLGKDKLTVGQPLMLLTLSALTGLVIWSILKPSIFTPRYFLANLMLLMPLPMIAAEAYLIKSTRIVGKSAIVVLFALAAAAAPYKPPAGVWTAFPGKIFAFIADGLPQCGLAISSYCSAFVEINTNTSTGGRVFVLGYYTFFLDASLLMTINTPEEYNELLSVPAEALWQTLYDEGFRTIAVQRATHEAYLSILRRAPIPSGLRVTERFEDDNMPVFYIEPE